MAEIQVNNKSFKMTLENNDAARALSKLLPLELNMSELNGNEKYFYLDSDLPSDPVYVGEIHAGDVMLYDSNCIVIFYKTFSTSYSYTRLGTLDNATDLEKILGSGDVSVKFDMSLITGTKGNDNIENTESGVIINALGGNDFISNKAVVENYYEDEDEDYPDDTSHSELISTPDNVLIDGGVGNDSIFNDGSNVLINGGKGNDYIRNNARIETYELLYDEEACDAQEGEYVTDTLFSSDNVSISGGEGDDEILNNGSRVTINGDAGNDTIRNDIITTTYDYHSDGGAQYTGDIHGKRTEILAPDSVSIDGGADNDYIINEGRDVSITGGTGNDTIRNNIRTGTYYERYYNMNTDENYKKEGTKILVSPDNVLIDGGADNDYIVNEGRDVSITGGTGNDTIRNNIRTGTYYEESYSEYDENYKEEGTKILASPDNVLIDGGKGDDYFFNEGEKVIFNYASGDGNDTIKGFNSTSTLSISGGSYSTQANDFDLVVKVGKGNIVLKDVGLKIETVRINNKGINLAKAFKLTDSDDVIEITRSSFSIDLGAGDDSIVNKGSDVSISAGAGNDYIFNDGENVLFNYASGDGNDTIEGFNSTSTLSISSSTYSTTASGNDILVKVGDGSIRLVDAKGTTLNIKGTKSAATSLTVTDKTKSPVTIGSAIKTIDASKRTTAVKITGNALANTIKGSSSKDILYGGAGNDYIFGNAGADKLYGETGNDTLRGNGGNDTLTGGAGNDLFICGSGNEVITDYATGDRISLASAITKTSVSSSDVVFTLGKNSLTVKNAKGKSLSMINSAGKSYSTIVSDLITVTDKTKSPVTVGSAIKTINASSRTKAAKVTGNALANIITGGSGNDSIYGGKGNDSLIGNAGNDLISGGEGNDTLYGKKGNDKLYGNDGADKISGGDGNDTLWAGKGNDTLWGNAGKDIFVYSAGNDVIADYSNGDRISLGAAITKTTLSGSDVVFTMGKNSLTVKNAKGKSLSIINSAGNSYSTIVSDLITVTDKTKSPVTVGSAIKTIDAAKRTKAVKITGNELANTIKGGTSNDTLYGGKGNDYIYGGSGADELYGETGNDTLCGNGGNDTLTGGKGYDLFICGSGKEVITDYTTGDKISVASAITKTAVSGSDVVFTLGKNSLTVKNAKGKTLNMISSKGNSYSTVVGGSTTLNVTDKTKSPVTVGSAIKTIDASKRTTAVKITGNALANTITGGSGKDIIYGKAGNDSILGNKGNDKLYGGAGNDTLTGGKGNDSLWGNAGKDTFIYADSDGKDIIYGFDNTDMLKISGAFSISYSKSKGEIYFKVDSTANAITLKDFSATSFNVNGLSYKISGAKIVKR